MKRGMEEFNLRNAFAQEPERCHQALMNAARSVREDEPVKKYTLSTVLIAAVLIIAMMAAALAATGGGLTNWFKRYYHTDVPKAAQDILSSTEKSVLEAGPVVFAVNELLCDGKIAYLTVQARLKEEGSALLYPASGDCFERIGEMTAQKLNHPDVNAQSTYLEAAQRTGLPLWCTDAWLEVDNYNLVDFEMCDGTVLEDGSLLMVRMLYFNEPYAADTLPVEVMVQANELELETLEYMEGSRERAAEKRSIAIHGVTEERTYSPQKEAKLADGDSLTRVVAQKTSAGVYVSLYLQAEKPLTLRELHSRPGEYHVLDENGNRFPTGMSLSGEWLDGQGNPFPSEVPPEEVELETFRLMRMISVDKLPEGMIVTDGETMIPVN